MKLALKHLDNNAVFLMNNVQGKGIKNEWENFSYTDK